MKNKTKASLVITFFIASVLLISCGITNPITGSKILPNGNWELTYITGPRIAFDGLYPNKKPTMLISSSDGKVSGNTGCNTYNGSVTVDSIHIRFSSQMAVTKMMCNEGMQGETVFLGLLPKIDRYQFVNDELVLMINGLSVMRFVKK